MDYGYGVIRNMGFFSFVSIYVYARLVASISPRFRDSEFEREQEMDRMRLSYRRFQLLFHVFRFCCV